MTGPAVEVAPGDAITSFMFYNETTTEWIVYGKNLATGEESSLAISRADLGDFDFDWAMVILSCDIGILCALVPISQHVSTTITGGPRNDHGFKQLL